MYFQPSVFDGKYHAHKIVRILRFKYQKDPVVLSLANQVVDERHFIIWSSATGIIKLDHPYWLAQGTNSQQLKRQPGQTACMIAWMGIDFYLHCFEFVAIIESELAAEEKRLFLFVSFACIWSLIWFGFVLCL